MAPAEICELNLTDLSRLIAAREVSSSEAVSAALTRLEQLEGKLNAFITVLREQALAEAKKADEEIARGNYRGALHGIPVTIKDMFEMAGVLTTGGSKILAEWVPETDSALVERLKAAGAIILGKTNLDEFGHGGTSTLSHFGPVHNPWDIERIAGFPGGSGLYSCCSAARIRDQLDRRSSIKSGVKAFSITFGFATNKMVPDDSLAEGTIYVLNNVPKTASNLSKAPILSAG